MHSRLVFWIKNEQSADQWEAISRDDSSDYPGHLEQDWHQKAINTVKRPSWKHIRRSLLKIILKQKVSIFKIYFGSNIYFALLPCQNTILYCSDWIAHMWVTNFWSFSIASTLPLLTSLLKVIGAVNLHWSQNLSEIGTGS